MYGNPSIHANAFGTTWGTSYRRTGVGANLPAVFDTTITTPAEKVGQYAVIGSSVGLALGVIWMLASNVVPKRQQAVGAALIALPLVGAIGGIAAAKQEYA